MPSSAPNGMGREVMGFAGMSALSFVLNVGTTFALVEFFGAAPELAFATGLTLVLITSFVLMRVVIFQSTASSVLQQFGMYAPSAVGFRALEYVAFLLAHTLFGAQYQVAVITILLISAITKFFFYRQVVFSG